MKLCNLSIEARLLVGSVASIVVTIIPFSILMFYELSLHHRENYQNAAILGLFTLMVGFFLGAIIARFTSKSIINSIQCLERNINHVIDSEELEHPCTPEFTDIFVKLTLLKKIYQNSNIEKEELARLLSDLNDNIKRNNILLNKASVDGQDVRKIRRVK